MGGHESHYISIYYHQLDVYEYIIWSGTYMYECFVWFCAPFYIWHLQLGIYAWCSSYGWVLVVFQFQGVVCMAVIDVCLTTIAILTRVTHNGLFFHVLSWLWVDAALGHIVHHVWLLKHIGACIDVCIHTYTLSKLASALAVNFVALLGCFCSQVIGQPSSGSWMISGGGCLTALLVHWVH